MQKKQRQLFQQITQSLRQNDMISLNIIFQDQSIAQLQSLSKYIQQQLHDKYMKLLEEWIPRKKQLQGVKQQQENIRKINNNSNIHRSEESQQNIIETCLKKQRKSKLVIQDRFGYQYYGNIKCLMIAYGDLQPNQESIKMMHSQLQILFSSVFRFIQNTQADPNFNILGTDNNLNESMRPSRRSKSKKVNSEIDLEEYSKDRIGEKRIRRYLQLVFKQQYASYVVITKQCKKATKSTKNKEEQMYSDFSSESEQSSQQLHQREQHLKQQNCQAQQSQLEKEKEQGVDQIVNNADHMRYNSKQETQYFAMLTKFMGQQEYERYSDNRAVNFINHSSSEGTGGGYYFTNKSSSRSKNNPVANNNKNMKRTKWEQNIVKLVKYIDEQAKILKPHMNIFDLLSFICCRIIRKIVFLVIRSRQQGKLLPLSTWISDQQSKNNNKNGKLDTDRTNWAYITCEQIKNIGNKLIQQYQKQFQIIKQNIQTISSIAKRLFIQDLTHNNFRLLMPKVYSPYTFYLLHTHPTNSTTEQIPNAGKMVDKTAEQIWQECRHYREMWINRVTGEKEVQLYLNAAQIDMLYPSSYNYGAPQSQPQRSMQKSILMQNQKEKERQKIQQIELWIKNEYGKFILRNIECYRTMGRTELWKKYFTHDKTSMNTDKSMNTELRSANNLRSSTRIRNTINYNSGWSGHQEQARNQPRKKVKLQSLKN